MDEFEKSVLRLLTVIANGQTLLLIAQNAQGELGQMILQHQKLACSMIEKVAEEIHAYDDEE